MLRDQPPEAVGLVADRRLLLTADKSRMVEEGDLAAAFLLASPGTTIPAAEVKRLGLSADKDNRVVQLAAEPEPDTEVKELPKPEDKQRTKPADKSVTKPATKRRSKRRT